MILEAAKYDMRTRRSKPFAKRQRDQEAEMTDIGVIESNDSGRVADRK
jgi:hypothetical protein